MNESTSIVVGHAAGEWPIHVAHALAAVILDAAERVQSDAAKSEREDSPSSDERAM